MHNPANNGLAVIEDGCVVIRLPIEILGEEHILPRDLLDDDFRPTVRVTDPNLFAQYFCNALNHESEDGETPVLALYDRAMVRAVEDGAEGVDWLKK